MIEIKKNFGYDSLSKTWKGEVNLYLDGIVILSISFENKNNILNMLNAMNDVIEGIKRIYKENSLSDLVNNLKAISTKMNSKGERA